VIDLVLYMPPQFDIGHWEFHAYREGGSLIETKDCNVEIRPEHPDLLEKRDHRTYGTGTEYHFTFNGGDNFVCYASDQVTLMTVYCNYDNPPLGIVSMGFSYKIRANNFTGSDKRYIAMLLVDCTIPGSGPHYWISPSPQHIRPDSNKENTTPI
jgi:hypothetical protein